MRTIIAATAVAAITALIAPTAAPAEAQPSESPRNATTASTAATTASTTRTAPIATERNGSFDLQSHRGGRGEWTEESLAAFANSLELGVTTLEVDTHLTEDNKVVMWHDDVMTASKCADTAPAFANDPEFPYADVRVRELSLAQVQTMDCGYQQLPGYPEQDVIEGNRIAELSEIFTLANSYGAKKVGFNIETKVEVAGPDGAVEMEALTRAVIGEIQASGLAGSSTLQSFDWASLNLAEQIAPDLRLGALSSGDVWLGVGQPGASVNLGGIDIDDFGGSLPRAAKAQGYDLVSPAFRSLTPAMITEAHELGLPVMPWTVSTAADINAVIDMGVDGIITDYPTRLRGILAERGLKLPTPYAAKA